MLTETKYKVTVYNLNIPQEKNTVLHKYGISMWQTIKNLLKLTCTEELLMIRQHTYNTRRKQHITPIYIYSQLSKKKYMVCTDSKIDYGKL